MKILTRFLALAALAVVLGSCSFAVGSLNHRKSRVVASAVWHGSSAARATRAVRSVHSRSAAMSLFPLVRKSRALPPRPASATLAVPRSSARVASKDISASTDIDYITYTITNLNPSSGEADIQDYLDPYYPYIDIYLTPGQNYRITVDVTLLQGSLAQTAGALVGISDYGDSAVIAVPEDGSDVWVDMAIHALGIVIKNQVTGGNTMHWVNPTTGAPGSQTLPAAANPLDKFFYTSDSLLYYFNFASKSVSQLGDISSPLSLDLVNFVGTQVSGSFQIYAVCPDPAYPGWFYVVGIDSGVWYLYVVNYDPAGGVQPAVWYQVGDITADLEFGRVGATVTVTGVAADPYGFAYVTFYNTTSPGVGTPVSGMVEFDSYGGPPAIEQFIPDTTGAWTSANSIFTDVNYAGSNIYILASPNTTAGAGVNHNTGTADVFTFDIFFNQLSTNPSPVAQFYNGAVSLTGGSSLILPNKFAGMTQGGSFFLSQADFIAGGLEYLSAVSLDLSSVRSVP